MNPREQKLRTKRVKQIQKAVRLEVHEFSKRAFGKVRLSSNDKSSMRSPTPD